jgi:hypothetical protein
MKKIMQLWLNAIRWACSIAGPILIILAIVWSTRTLIFLRSASGATGTVIRLVPYRNDNDEVEYATVFKFSADNGTTQTVESSLHTQPAGFVVGQQVPVLYRPGSPADARIATFMQLWFFPVVIGGMGVLAAMLAAWLWFHNFRKSHPRSETHQTAAAKPLASNS